MQKNLLTKRLIEKRSKIDTKTGCWLWSGYLQSTGYGQLRLDGKMKLAHRMSWIVFRGDIPDGMCVCHKCDTPRCVNPEHLFLGSHLDNTADAYAKGRMAIQKEGFDFHFTRLRRYRKLTDKAVLEIRASNEPLIVLSERYGVSKACISTTRRGKRKQLVQ